MTRGMALLADEWLNGVSSAVGQGDKEYGRGYPVDIIVDVTWRQTGHNVDIIMCLPHISPPRPLWHKAEDTG